MSPWIWIALAAAALPAGLFVWNLFYFRRLPRAAGPEARVSVLIPARDEESSIAAAVESALASRGVAMEVVVLDDHSADRTADIVEALAKKDPRVRLASAPPLPAGWCGKQHACSALSRLARYPLLCFIDADVRLAPDALARMAAAIDARDAALLSGFPRQITGTLLEKLLIPLIHIVLLGFLPLAMARRSRSPSFAAGCGQLMMVRREAYEKTGGHAEIRESLHDGIRLPRLFRRHGLHAEVFDATDLAACRMYQSAGGVWFGLAKNAVEGMAAPVAIFVFTALLLGGQILPFVLLAAGERGSWLLAAAACAYLPRLVGAWRFRQSAVGALLHPVGVGILLAIQWYARIRAWAGLPARWKSRAYTRQTA